jgi:hypothetical protein
MLLFILLVAAANLALGYGSAVYLGWAKMPVLRKPAAPAETAAVPHGHGH